MYTLQWVTNRKDIEKRAMRHRKRFPSYHKHFTFHVNPNERDQTKHSEVYKNTTQKSNHDTNNTRQYRSPSIQKHTTHRTQQLSRKQRKSTTHTKKEEKDINLHSNFN